VRVSVGCVFICRCRHGDSSASWKLDLWTQWALKKHGPLMRLPYFITLRWDSMMVSVDSRAAWVQAHTMCSGLCSVFYICSLLGWLPQGPQRPLVMCKSFMKDQLPGGMGKESEKTKQMCDLRLNHIEGAST
jgi:hypothetical protein